MQHTFHLKAGNMTPAFADLVRKMFGDEELTIFIEHAKPNNISRNDFHKSVMELRELFKDVKVDPSIDISRLADEVNL